jgi:hypothetical protein
VGKIFNVDAIKLPSCVAVENDFARDFEVSSGNKACVYAAVARKDDAGVRAQRVRE